MIDKTQRLTSYISNAGVHVFEREQYNAKTKQWYIVDNSSTSETYLQIQVDRHNGRLNVVIPSVHE